MKRMRCGCVCMTSDVVRTPSPKKRTPFISVPSVTPVAAKTMLLPGREVLRPVDPLEVGDAHRAAALLVLRRADDEPRVDLAAQAAHRRGGDHALGRAADPHHRVHAAADHGRRDAGGQVAVADQPDARAGRTNLLDERLVPRPIEHDHDQVLDPAAQRLGDGAQVEAHRRIEIDDVARARADDQLLHVDVRRVEQAALLRRRQHGQRVRRAGGAQVRALERIDGDVDFRIVAGRLRRARPCRPSRRCTASALRPARPRRSRSCRRSGPSPSRCAWPRRRPDRTCAGRPVPSCGRRQSPPAPRRAGSRVRGRSRQAVRRVLIRVRDSLGGHHVSHAGSSHRVGLSVR